MFKTIALHIAATALAIAGNSAHSAETEPPSSPAGSEYLRLAQGDSSPSPVVGDRSRKADEGKLDEILVTARRREENVQSVPIAITVVTEQTLRENNVLSVGDLQYLVPSMSGSYSDNGRTALDINIRGQGQSSNSAEPAVIAYLNEVPIPDFNGNLAGGPGLLFDLENVQVLKGPQGTLFGKNSVGGALLLQTARPTNDFGGRMQATYGNYNDREFDGAINIPIINDSLLTRVAINGQLRDGFTRLLGEPGLPNGIVADNRDYWSVRGTVTFRPNDGIQNDTILTYQNYKSHGSPLILTNLNPSGPASLAYPTFPALFAEQQALGIRTALPVSSPVTGSGSFLSLNNISRFSLPGELTLRNIIGLDDATQKFGWDGDGTILPIQDVSSPRDERPLRQYTDEIQVLGKSLGERLDWIAGAFYQDSYFRFQEGFTNFGPPPVPLQYWNASKSKALFGQGSYDLSTLITGLKFTVGARYTWDERHLSALFGGPPGSDVDTKEGAPTWTVGLDYQAAPNTLLYLASRRGYRVGGSNAVGGIAYPNFNPEYVTDVELGVKSDWKVASVPIRTNIAIYDQNFSNIQVPRSVDINNYIATVTVNGAAARITGAEFEARVQLVEDLQLGFSFDYVNFKYTRFDQGVDPAPLISTRTFDAPPRKYSVNARYHVPLAPKLGDLSVKANWHWQASNGDFSQPGGVIAAFSLLNLSADWEDIGGQPLDVSLFTSNLTNKVYTAGTLPNYYVLGYSQQLFGEPRMYGIRLRYRFCAEGK
jgi:iron complex outermembrane receptor protein